MTNEGGTGAEGERVIFLVEADLGAYQSLVMEPSEYDRVPALRGQSVADAWQAPLVVSDDASLPVPDIWHVTMNTPSSFAMSLSVAERLEPFVGLAGELLPLRTPTAGTSGLFVLNILVWLEFRHTIDLAASRPERERMMRTLVEDGVISAEELPDFLARSMSGNGWPLLYPDFIEENLPEKPTLFRVEWLPGVFMLDAVEGEDTLAGRIERLGITGLNFTKLWSSATGPEPLDFFE